jgi:hypothetical protein
MHAPVIHIRAIDGSSTASTNDCLIYTSLYQPLRIYKVSLLALFGSWSTYVSRCHIDIHGLPDEVGTEVLTKDRVVLFADFAALVVRIRGG